jgi:hypothetical protein
VPCVTTSQGVIQHCPGTFGTDTAAKVDCRPETPGSGHFCLDHVGNLSLFILDLSLFIPHLTYDFRQF